MNLMSKLHCLPKLRNFKHSEICLCTPPEALRDSRPARLGEECVSLMGRDGDTGIVRDRSSFVFCGSGVVVINGLRPSPLQREEVQLNFKYVLALYDSILKH